MSGDADERYDRASTRAMTGRRAQRGRDSDVEGAVLDATAELLAEVRLHELKVSEIIERAGISRATFYFYFSSKFAVVAAVLTRSVDAIVEAVQPWVAGDDPEPHDRFVRSLEAAGRLWFENRHVLCSVSESWAVVEEFEELWLATIARFVDAFTAVVEQDTAAGITVVEGEVRELITTLVWGTERAFYMAARGIEPAVADPAVVVRQLQHVWLRTIYGTEAAATG